MLVVSGTGLVGKALVKLLLERGHEVVATQRRSRQIANFLDLECPQLAELPRADIIFLVAAMPGFAACEGNSQSWRVNVDAPLFLARSGLGFPVFISSDCVEWSGAAYARQKAYAELGILLLGGAVVRPARITPDRVEDFCSLLDEVGVAGKSLVYRWPRT